MAGRPAFGLPRRIVTLDPMRLLILLLGTLVSLAAAEPVTVLAAASLTEALTEIGKAFELAHPPARIRVASGASSQLRLQIQQGAPAQVFASADEVQMDILVREGRIKQAHHLATNRLALLARQAGPVKTWKDLAHGGVRLVMTQASVPIGAYTDLLLDRLGEEAGAPPRFAAQVRRNVVSREAHVRQLRAKVELGEADAAVVYATDVLPPKPGLRVVPIPDSLQPRIQVTVGALEPAGDAFVAFALGPQGQAVLRRLGFR